MVEMNVTLTDNDKAVKQVTEQCVESVPLNQNTIWLRVDADFRLGEHGGRDAANFYYSLDGQQWTKIGSNDYKMRFDWQRFFMGSKIAIFCYATKRKCGYVDIDSFNYSKD
jgi:beta-xylosidase